MTSSSKPNGFTLIEVMVVIVIIAILAAIVVPKIMQRPEQAKNIAARQDIIAIENALSLYQLDNGFYPSTEQGLLALSKKPQSDPVPSNWAPGGYLKSLPKTPWGQNYQYQNPGKHGNIDIWCLNRDKQVIGNWQSTTT